MELSEIRTRIDAVDDQLLKLFLERMELAEEVAAYKNEHHLPILNKQRERDRFLRSADGRRRLDADAQRERHTGGDAAEDAAGTVRLRDDAAVLHAEGVVVFASAQARSAEACAELHALDGGDAEQRRGGEAVPDHFRRGGRADAASYFVGA